MKNKTRIIRVLSLLVMIIFLFPLITYAATHYVSPTGTASWANSTDIGQPCSLATANTNATAGDTIYLRGGTYTDQYINPSNSGTSWNNQIIFRAYTGETPTLTKGSSTAHAITINGKDYIKVDGINVSNVSRFFYISNGADYNEITNCTMDTSDSTFESGASCRIWSSVGGTASTYNWIHGNTISRHGHVSAGCKDKGSIMQVGVSYYDYVSNHNLIEDNTFYYGGHDCLETFTMYNVIRNNVFHNEGWVTDIGGCPYPPSPNGKYGNRNLQVYDGNSRSAVYNLIEGNRFGHAGSPPDDDGAHNLVITSAKNIVRYNFCFNADGSGLYFKQGAGSDSDNNRVYNNTFYHNGQGDAALKRWGVILYFQTPPSVVKSTGNVVKNNLFYDNTSGDYTCRAGVCLDYYLLENTFTNNYLNADGDPLFVNTDMSDKMSLTLPDLSLRSGSGAIDRGTYLTTVHINDTGSGTSLIVADAGYFQDGSWGPSGKINADWIAVGTVGNYVQISSINYLTNTITLSSSISRNDGDNVWLVKDSSGNIVLRGSAPDMGAYEYPGHITPQKNLRIVP